MKCTDRMIGGCGYDVCALQVVGHVKLVTYVSVSYAMSMSA
jgi:hypothetical protein